MPSSSRRDLQGPRPPPLRIDRASQISKSPSRPGSCSSAASSSSGSSRQSPVVVHVLSPKVVHTSPQEFMSTVQRLTGKSSPPAAPADPPAGKPDPPRPSPPVLYQFLI